MSSPSAASTPSPATSEQEHLASPGIAQENPLDADISHYVGAEDSAGTRMPSNMSPDDDWSPCFTQVPDVGTSSGTDAQGTGIANPSQQRSALIDATHTAHRLKLHPYQVSHIKTFVTNPWSSQLAETFCELLTLGNKLEQVVSQQAHFTVDTALAKTIKSYTLGVALSEKLRAYKGNMPINLIFTIILKQQTNVPSNLSKNPFVQEVIKSHIGGELMQLRSMIKKKIKMSIEKNWSIYQLAALLAKSAFHFCKVYMDLPSPETTNFWDTVDARLEYFHTKVNNNVDAIRKILSGTLKDDHMKYGALESDYDIPEEGGDFEHGINDNM